MSDPIIITAVDTDSYYLMGPFEAAQAPLLGKIFSPEDIKTIQGRLTPDGQGNKPSAYVLLDSYRHPVSVIFGDMKEGNFFAKSFRAVTSVGMDIGEQFITKAKYEDPLPLRVERDGRVDAKEALDFIDLLPSPARDGVSPIRLPEETVPAKTKLPFLPGQKIDPVERGEYSSAENFLSDGKPLNKLAMELLDKYDGVFFGEEHDKPSVLQSTTKLLPLLKAKGVGTVSYELPQEMMDTIQSKKTRLEAYQTYINMDRRHLDAVFDLTKEAQRLDIKVLGHENNALRVLQLQFSKTDEDLTFKEKDLIEKDWEKTESRDVMNKRDSWSAEYITKHKVPDKKVVIIGGAYHSKKLDPVDKETKEYPGLNVRLGYPSVDYQFKYPLKTSDYGHTYAKTEEGADYTLTLPVNLSERLESLNIKSWPPQRKIKQEPLPDEVFAPLQIPAPKGQESQR